jgi:hypothetical protein
MMRRCKVGLSVVAGIAVVLSSRPARAAEPECSRVGIETDGSLGNGWVELSKRAREAFEARADIDRCARNRPDARRPGDRRRGDAGRWPVRPSNRVDAGGRGPRARSAPHRAAGVPGPESDGLKPFGERGKRALDGVRSGAAAGSHSGAHRPRDAGSRSARVDAGPREQRGQTASCASVSESPASTLSRWCVPAFDSGRSPVAISRARRQVSAQLDTVAKAARGMRRACPVRRQDGEHGHASERAGPRCR